MAAVDAPLYTRVPKELKDRIGEYKSATSARSEAAAIAALLAVGLTAASTADHVAELTDQVADLKQRLAEETAARVKAEQQHAVLIETVSRWSARAEQKIAKCPECGHEVTGDDLLVTGVCPNEECRYSLSIMLTPPNPGDQRQRDNFLLLLAATGLVLGAVAIANRAS